ncbi:MAG TPA: large conductance mechanosensitive channel protein MscL [Candidatus Limnocylindrales bacterium]|nr:large conductance mechanosensitive channel protein MscL [Candidatus Limnocylindrales bacterium]
MYAEFKAFLLKSNALALAIGVILGVALGTVVQSLVNDIIMPVVSRLIGGVDFSQWVFDLGNGVVVRWGAFISALVTFVIVAFVVFMIARSLIKEPAADEVKVCPFCKEPNAVDATKCKACTSAI